MSANYWEDKYSSHWISNDSDGWLYAHKALISPGAAVLDLGCGAGTNIGDLLQMGARVTAADFSQNAIAAVRAHFGANLQGADCFDMRGGFPYRDASFDAVVADLSLHYFSWADTMGIIGEIHRILRRNGILIARVHSLKNLDCAPEAELEPHYYIMYGFPRRYFAEEEIRKLFSGWMLASLQERSICRYQCIKKVIEFTAGKL